VIFKAAIFDLDGTLLDTLEDLADAMNLVLERNRLPVHEAAAYRYFVGDGIEMLVRRALPFEVEDEAILGRFVGEMRSEYDRRWSAKTKPYPGIPEMLDAAAAAGLAMAVLSNKPDGPAGRIVRTYFPSIPFRLVAGATFGRPKKPDPAAALDISARLGVAPRECLFMGDTAVDMQTAAGAGMFALGVLWGFRTAEELISSGARMLARQPADLIPWLGRRRPG
jgi:phosphoglycolate phosphatase